MKRTAILLGFILCYRGLALAQNYTPTIEPCPCLMKVDPRLKTICGYLVVPENRRKPEANKIKIPFVFARRPDQDSTKNIALYMTGGPGYATIPVGDSLRYQSGWLAYGGFIFFDQRGTKNSIPCLDCEGIDEAIKESYILNLPEDSLVGEAVKQCRKKLANQGIDLSAYNSVETVADIVDIKNALKIDSLTLFGISYSGGLMLNVARNHPEGIKALLLNSPLPSYVNYEEHALFNHQEALNQLFENIEADSVQNNRYPNLRKRFYEYFTAISSKRFTINLPDTDDQSGSVIQYSKNELLNVVFDRMSNSQTVPGIIDDLLKGEHEKYVREVIERKFSGDKSLSYGMRLSVYCSEQIAYSDTKKIEEQDEIIPWLAGYKFNNVNREICDCWAVEKVPDYIKTPVYSRIPALISAGSLDPWTRPFYSRLIKRTMPNAQLLIIRDKAHGAGFGGGLLDSFLTNPYSKLTSPSENIIVE